MDALSPNTAGIPAIELARTPQDFKTFAERTLECKEKVVYYAGGIENIMVFYEQAYENDYYIPTRVERNILVKMLVPDSPVMRNYQSSDSQELRETRCLPEDMGMEDSFMIHDDTVVFFSGQQPLFALAITSPSIAKTMKIVFNKLWQNAQ